MGLHDISDAKFHGESYIALQNDIGPFGGGDIKAQRYTEFCILGGHRVDRSAVSEQFFPAISELSCFVFNHSDSSRMTVFEHPNFGLRLARVVSVAETVRMDFIIRWLEKFHSHHP